MANRRTTASSGVVLVLLVAAIGLWFQDLKRGDSAAATSSHGNRANSTAPAEVGGRTPDSAARRTSAYETYRGCRWVEQCGNDGDSFTVRLEDGREEVFRLYFVDTPESRFRRYAGGDTNYARIRQQAADLGNITPEQAVEIGVKGKQLTHALLSAEPFTIHTCWDSPFHDKRYHAFVEVRDGGKPRWLHEILIERGLARIKTKPADLPDGTSASDHLDHLRSLEREAKRKQLGVWGL